MFGIRLSLIRLVDPITGTFVDAYVQVLLQVIESGTIFLKGLFFFACAEMQTSSNPYSVKQFGFLRVLGPPGRIRSLHAFLVAVSICAYSDGCTSFFLRSSL